MNPLVSILIPAYNAEQWIAQSIQSAVGQTWPRKEIIVVDDGSKDRTAAIAQSFGRAVKVVSNENQGAAATRNKAFRLSQGDYIQWLDADDLLAPDKIERQLAALGENGSRRILLSCPWAPFYYRTENRHFVQNSLCADLSPVEWLLHKMGENLHMQTATWLTSRELAEAAGQWDSRLLSDDDGEYFCRVLLACERTLFVPDAKVFYRTTSLGRLSRIGGSNRKKDAMVISMKLHVRYLRSMEDSERVRKACLTYLQNWFIAFYPERPDLVAELQLVAANLGGRLLPPRLRWKYAWMKPVFGWRAAKWAQDALPQFKISCVRRLDKLSYDYSPQSEVASRHMKMHPITKQAKTDSSAPWSAGVSASSVGQTVSVDKKTEKIPMRIIQTGKDVNLPLLQRAASSSMRTMNPQFDYQFFDDYAVEHFVTREYPQYRAVFDGFAYRIQKFDFFRYLAIYRYGGFYFDLDVLLASSLEPLRESGCVFSFEALTVSRYLREKLGMDWLLGNYGFGAYEGHPFLLAVIENCVRAQRDSGWVRPMKAGSPPFLADEFLILNSTGPGLVSRTYAENPSLAKTVSVLFPEDVSDLQNWNCFGEYGVHLMVSSWRKRKNYVCHKIADFSWRWIQHRNIQRARSLGERRAGHGPMVSLSGL